MLSLGLLERGHVRRRAVVGSAAVCLACVVGLGLWLDATAVEAKTTTELSEELSQAKESLSQARANADKAKATQLAAQQDIAGLDQKIEVLQQRVTDAANVRDIAATKLAKTRKTLVKVNSQLKSTQAQYNKAQADLTAANAALAARAVSIYKAGGTDYFALVFEARALSDLVGQVDLLSKVMDQDRKMVEQIRALQAKVLEEGNALQETKAQASAVEGQQQKDTDALDKVVKQQKAALNEVSDARAAKRAVAAKAEKDLVAWQAREKELLRQSQDIEAVLRGNSAGGSVHGSGRLIWPVDGPITSPFGERENPIFHRMEMHTGIDIGAAEGTPIYAADSGTVVFAGWKGGYGKATIIGHGNGLATLYGHQSKLLVSEGQTVNKGQLIGRVGSTGWATGPHLHFEVRLNGTPVNPMKYL
jgi:murein DD-endopeptidase MepM/ murein hydrolase activator NlpD